MGFANDKTGAARILDVRRVGRIAYADAHRLQEALVEQRIAGSIRDTLVLCEHDSVITLGRKTPKEDIAGLAIPLIQVERGGEATYHGPGQLVVYPIVLLDEAHRDLHRYLRDLEGVVIGMLADVGIVGGRKPGSTGVWVGERKICSIGVAVRRWVAWHGFALNISTDLAEFAGFRPCGLEPDVMTRVLDHVDVPDAMARFEASAASHFAKVFGFTLAN